MERKRKTRLYIEFINTEQWQQHSAIHEYIERCWKWNYLWKWNFMNEWITKRYIAVTEFGVIMLMLVFSVSILMIEVKFDSVLSWLKLILLTIYNFYKNIYGILFHNWWHNTVFQLHFIDHSSLHRYQYQN